MTSARPVLGRDHSIQVFCTFWEEKEGKKRFPEIISKLLGGRSFGAWEDQV